MHCASNYPAKKSKSDIDIELQDNMEDNEYLEVLKKNLRELNKNTYDFVFYVAGVDIHYEDRLGKLKITDEGVNKRDQIVIENFYSKKFLYAVFLAVVIIKVLINLLSFIQCYTKIVQSIFNLVLALDGLNLGTKAKT